METRKIVLRETGIIAIGECVGVAVMIIIFALLGQFDRSVVLGGLIGGILSILNFFLMAVNANDAADKAINQDVKSGKAMLQFSYAVRLAMIFRHPFCMREKQLVQCVCDCDSASFCQTNDYNS